jgi:hypothetical protein
MQVRRALVFGVAALSLVTAACSSVASVASPSAMSPAAMSPSPAASPSALPTRTPVQAGGSLAPAAPAVPSVMAVTFSGLRSGIYPVHVHSRCDGTQMFHIITLASLRVGSMGSGTIGVPSGYFGRGLCLIVYANPNLSAVLTTRRI